MAEIIEPNFASTDIELANFDISLDLSPEVQQTLARLLGWSDKDDKFYRIRADEYGRLVTTPFQSAKATETVWNSTLVANVANLLLTDEAGRVGLRIENRSPFTVYIAWKSFTSALSGKQILPGEYQYFNEHKGQIWGFCADRQAVIVLTSWTI